MAQGGDDLCLDGGFLLALSIFEHRVAGGAGVVGVAAVLDASSRLRLRQSHGVTQGGQDYAGRIRALGAVLIRKVSIANEAVPVFPIADFCAGGRLPRGVLRIVNVGGAIVDRGIGQ